MIMSKSTVGLFSLLILCATFGPSRANSFAETFVSNTGNDGNTCNSSATPCRTFEEAFNQASAGGQITVLNAADYGFLIIDKSISIVNATSGTATVCCNATTFDYQSQITTGQIFILAGTTDVVTLRGLEMLANGYGSGIVIANAERVNIEHCIIRNASSPGILVYPTTFGNGTVASSFAVKIEDTTISNSTAGIKILSASGVTVSAAISRSQIDNNAGGGIRIDGSDGGAITATISDSHIGLNGANGVVAISGSSGNVLVTLVNDVIASNSQAGVESSQSGGGASTMTVSRTTLSNNGSAFSIVGDAALLSYGNNEVTGVVGSAPGHISFQ